MTSAQSGSRVIVTGVSGLLGQSLLRLLDQDARVRTIIGIDIREPVHRSGKLEFYPEDITSPRLETLFKHVKPTHVIHLAFVVKPVHDSKWAHRIDVEGTRNVLTAALAAGARSVVAASSNVVYGAHQRPAVPIEEITSLQPDPGHSYSADKCDVEQLCETYQRDHPDVAISTVRVVTIVGPDMNNFISRALAQPIQILPWRLDPEWQFIHEDDAARAFLELAFAQSRGPFNLAADGTIRLSEIARAQGHPVIRLPQSVLYFIAEFGWRFRLRSVSEVPGVLTRYFCYPPNLDTGKIKRTLNITFKYSSRQAVEEAMIRKKSIPGGRVTTVIRYGCQFLGSLLILGAPLPNPWKLVLFLLLWAATFSRLARREWLGVMFVSMAFTGMDIGATRKGVFYFLHPDVAGLPLYEPFIFGFLALHAMRLLKGPPPQRKSRWLVYALVVLFAIPFQVTARSDVLFWTSLAILLAAFGFFHEKPDIAYAGYMVVLGALWEYTGVFRGQWAYPHPPTGGVPLWFMTMWGGFGLFVRRLVYLLVYGDRAAIGSSGGPGGSFDA